MDGKEWEGHGEACRPDRYGPSVGFTSIITTELK